MPAFPNFSESQREGQGAESQVNEKDGALVILDSPKG